MARKTTTKALYELMGGRRSETPRSTKPVAEPESHTWSWLSAGRTIRVPVGYLFLATALILVAVIVSFTLGYGRGQREAEAARAGEWLATHQPLPPPEAPPRSLASR